MDAIKGIKRLVEAAGEFTHGPDIALFNWVHQILLTRRVLVDHLDMVLAIGRPIFADDQPEVLVAIHL